MYIKLIKPDFKFEDERGDLIQLVHKGYRQVNYISSLGNSFRGGHYHKFNKELFYIIHGQLELSVWPVKQEDKEKYVFTSNDMFEIPEMIVHSFNFLENTTLISMYSNGVELDNGDMDIIKE